MLNISHKSTRPKFSMQDSRFFYLRLVSDARIKIIEKVFLLGKVFLGVFGVFTFVIYNCVQSNHPCINGYSVRNDKYLLNHISLPKSRLGEFLCDFYSSSVTAFVFIDFSFDHLLGRVGIPLN